MQSVSAWLLIPFIIMLLTIAIAPLVAGDWWEKNSNKLFYVLCLSIPTSIVLAISGLGGNLVHQILYDYLPFIILLCALFVVTGGIKLTINSVATPTVNTTMLFLATIPHLTAALTLTVRSSTPSVARYSTATVFRLS